MLSTLMFLSFVFTAFSRTLPDTVSELDVDNYLGHWYQVYGAPTNAIFQGYGTCITADYGLLDNGQVSVLNTQLNKNMEYESINGYAYYKDESEPGQLTIKLDGVPSESPYWVVKLGPVINNQYQYSVITTPSGVSMWVLARDVFNFSKYYDDDVSQFLNEFNFKYVSINQDNCQARKNITYDYYYSLSNIKTSVNSLLYSSYKSECQVANYLRKSGFPEYSIATMVCISKYESSFNCDATNKNTDGSTDYGLMQINS